ncbi:helix-turn-helix domain-containing protein [Vibrio sp. Of7-15]|uniref:phage repressor protein CI n=1 Tax=Vibrio sp. Of7-15 TaxID=2724879 RepID=UPI001EF364E6|nr:phage repressor protein CI [Vibrio sp. Of7-15]MCG7495613.1 helix-turn-helix domain-containing protein [Vibrio sp. Of7-15]
MGKDKILPFEYLKGSDFTDNLKRITKSKTLLEMSDLLNVPKQTFSTWNTHNRTSHELMVRLHLALGIPIEDMALSDEERAKLPNRPAVATASTVTPAPVSQAKPQPKQTDTVILPSVCLTNGKLIDTGEIPYATRRINKYDLEGADVIEVETNEAIFLVNQDIKSAVSGKYLVDIDGHLSINHIQRLPGKKLAIIFGDSTMEVSENDIEVVGKVVVEMRKG